MKKPSNDFNRVSDAQRAALEGLRTYAERLAEKQDAALTNHDLAWEAEKRRFQPKLQNEFHLGRITPRLTQREYRRLRAEFSERRKTIVDHYATKQKEIARMKEVILDRFNERAREPRRIRTSEHTKRDHDSGRER
ncbi:hypothetical protein [Oceanibium sediminis]|uniref:hypothetical protein n=1 Tax=Oceanibium sediminis TaxID=2026339 RepID=UPI000DD2F750|nr:hypothetical protein [Oceanibium sediminis]